jgi:hypothetical protein
MKAVDILEGLRRTYAAAEAYRDVGRVVLPHRAHRSRATIAEFRTAFLRSKGFRFEYREILSPKTRRDPSSSRTFGLRVEGGAIVDVSGFDCSRESMGLAVASMTGITFGAAHCVLKLLLPEQIPGRVFSEGSKPEVARKSVVDGHEWFAIRLKGVTTSEIVVDERYLLRRIGSRDGEAAGVASEASSFARVLVYEPELFVTEPTDLRLDW